MKIVSSNIKKILSLMIAVAIIITSFNTSNIEAKASTNHSKGYDWMVEKLDAYVADGTLCSDGVSIMARPLSDVTGENGFRENFITVTASELEELKTRYAHVSGRYECGYPSKLQQLYDLAWHKADPYVPGDVNGWAEETVNPTQDTSNSGSSNNNGSSNSNTASNTSQTANTQSAANTDKWLSWWLSDPSTDPETYGWDRELAKETFNTPLFAHHNIGYTFKSGSGIKYKVTREGGYRKIGHVEIIGYEPDQVNERTAENWMEEAAKNQPDGIKNAFDAWYAFNHIYGCESYHSQTDTAHDKMMRKKQGAKSSSNGRTSRINGTYELGTQCYQMLTDTYNPYDGGDEYHEFFLVTSIAPSAFKGNTQLKYVYIPASVQTIPKDCFKNCSNLEEVFWGSNPLKYAKNDECLRNSAFPKYNGKKRIVKGAFAGCKKLKRFKLDGLYGELKVDKKAFNKDKKAIEVLGYKCKNKYIKKFVKDIKNKGNSKKKAKFSKDSETDGL